MRINQNYTFTLQYFFLALLIFIFVLTESVFSKEDGKKTFTTICKACHTIGNGRLVGPDLADIQKRLKTDWIIKFIKSSQTVIKSGDLEAVRVFTKYNKIIMPDQQLTDKQILAILSYIKEKSLKFRQQSKQPLQVAKSSNTFDVSKTNVNIGRKYFSGENSFKNDGPACLSCHNVTNDKLSGGGRLAKDLTRSVSRLSIAGINAIISNPPFPIMKAAFENKALTTDEKHSLLAFLQQADVDSVNQSPVNYQKSFIFEGVGVFIFLIGLFAILWSNRKKESVKNDIFKRQLKSY